MKARGRGNNLFDVTKAAGHVSHYLRDDFFFVFEKRSLDESMCVAIAEWRNCNGIYFGGRLRGWTRDLILGAAFEP